MTCKHVSNIGLAEPPSGSRSVLNSGRGWFGPTQQEA